MAQKIAKAEVQDTIDKIKARRLREDLMVLPFDSSVDGTVLDPEPEPDGKSADGPSGSSSGTPAGESAGAAPDVEGPPVPLH